MIEIVRYVPKKHRELIQSWLLKRELPALWALELPHVGSVIYFKREPFKFEPIAMGFIRPLQYCQTAMIDSLITNPEVRPEIRHEMLDRLAEHLIDRARKRGFRQIVSWSRDVHTIERAKRLGFQVLPDTLVAFDLSRKDS